MVREDGVSFYEKRYPTLKKRIAFIPTWVDVETFYPYTEAKREKERLRFIRENAFSINDKLILFVGRFEGQKDPFLLIDSFYFLQKILSNVRLCIVGTGGMQNKLEQKVRKYNVSKKVKFMGPLPQQKVIELMRISDVFLLTSAFEGMPRSVLEALACGIPVVSTDVGEVRRVVKDGVSGIICTKRTPETLGNAVLTVLKSSKFPSENCTQVIQDYTAKRILGNIYRFYYQLSRIK
jgi:glycosyltransferase involved in cell wall biosynthesis